MSLSGFAVKLNQFSPAAGDVAYNAQDEEIINGTFRYHHGGDLPFVWKRVRQATLRRKKTRK